MEKKKSPRADLENKRGLFLMIGLAITLAIVLTMFEWKVDVSEQKALEDVVVEVMDEEMTPVTRQDEVKPPPPPPPAPRAADVIEIVDNDEEIEDELEIEDSEATEEQEVEPMAIVEEEEEVDDEKQIFVKVENMPIFDYMGATTEKDGQRDLQIHINRSIRYPVIAQENGIQGLVYVGFVVSRTGEVTSVKILRGVDETLDKEALRVVKALPKWKPGMQRNRAVNVSYTVPVRFVLQ